MSNKEKQIQMPQSFLTNVYDLLIAARRYDLAEDDVLLLQKIESQINAKLDAIERRNTFTQYKTAAVGSDERELHRENYLSAAGIHKDFTTQKETPLTPNTP